MKVQGEPTYLVFCGQEEALPEVASCGNNTPGWRRASELFSRFWLSLLCGGQQEER